MGKRRIKRSVEMGKKEREDWEMEKKRISLEKSRREEKR